MNVKHAGLCLATCGLALATPAVAQRPMIGPVVGLNFSSFGGSDATGSKGRTGFAVGGAIRFQSKSGFMFEPRLLYSVKGASYDAGGGISLAAKPAYLEVPVMFGYQFPMTGSQVRPRVFAGPDLGLEIGCKFSASGTDLNCNDASTQLSNQTLDFGVLGGVGIAFPMGSGSFDVSVHYSLGLTKIWSSSAFTTDIKNRAFSVAVAYLFPMGKGK